MIRFVEMFDKLSFPEAAKQLESPELELKSISQRAKPANRRTDLTVKDRKLLARVVGYYQHTLNEDSRGLNYLKSERGITTNQSINDFAVGYVNGTLLEILPE